MRPLLPNLECPGNGRFMFIPVLIALSHVARGDSVSILLNSSFLLHVHMYFFRDEGHRRVMLKNWSNVTILHRLPEHITYMKSDPITGWHYTSLFLPTGPTVILHQHWVSHFSGFCPILLNNSWIYSSKLFNALWYNRVHRWSGYQAPKPRDQRDS